MNEEDWTDGDRVKCKCCDRFVLYVNSEGFCPECDRSDEKYE